MTVRYAHLCDFTLISNDNKPSLIGIFDHIFGTRLPFALSRPWMAFVCFRVDGVDLGVTRKVRISILNPEGYSLLDFDSDLEIQDAGTGGNFFFNGEMSGVVFHEAGPHVLAVSVDGGQPYTCEFMVSVRRSA